MAERDSDRELGRRLLASVRAEDGDGLDDVLDATPAPLGPALPEGGWVAQSVERLTEGSMIPPEFALATSLACVAAAGQGGRVWRLGPNEWGTGLWVVCLAAAGGRKTSALAGIAPLEELLPAGRLQTSSTSESLAEAFEQTPDLWMAVPEFSTLMNETEKSYMLGVRDALNGTWDGGRYQSGDKRRVGGVTSGLPKYATTTIVGMATMSHFSEWAATNAIQQGFLTRVIFVPQSTEVAYAGLRQVAERRIVNTRDLYLGLERIRGLAHARPSGMTKEGRPRIGFDTEATAVLDAYDQAWTVREDLPPALEGFAKRLMPNAARVGYAHALARESTEVSADDAARGIALMEYARTRAWPLIARYHGATSFQGKLLARLEGTLDRLAARSGSGWVSERALKRHAHLYGTPYSDAVKHLVEVGAWEFELERGGARGPQRRMVRRRR